MRWPDEEGKRAYERERAREKFELKKKSREEKREEKKKKRTCSLMSTFFSFLLAKHMCL